MVEGMPKYTPENGVPGFNFINNWILGRSRRERGAGGANTCVQTVHRKTMVHTTQQLHTSHFEILLY